MGFFFISSLFFPEKNIQESGEINSKKGSHLENFRFSNQLVQHRMELRRCKSFHVPGLLTVTVYRVRNIQNYTCITRVPKQEFRKVNYMPRKRLGAPGAGPLLSPPWLEQGCATPHPTHTPLPHPATPSAPAQRCPPGRRWPRGARGLQTCPSPAGCHRARPTTQHNGFLEKLPRAQMSTIFPRKLFPSKNANHS